MSVKTKQNKQKKNQAKTIPYCKNPIYKSSKVSLPFKRFLIRRSNTDSRKTNNTRKIVKEMSSSNNSEIASNGVLRKNLRR